VLLALIALYALRHVKERRRRFGWQIVTGSIALIAAVVAFVFRSRIIDVLHAGDVINVRYDVWIQMWELIPTYQLQGWGWLGTWREDMVPYSIINALNDTPHENGLNAYLDVYLQVGLIGALLFVLLLALALSRSWLLASNKRSVIYVWPALILPALVTVSFAESSMLVESGWLLLVICSVKAAQGMSWRDALPR